MVDESEDAVKPETDDVISNFLNELEEVGWAVLRCEKPVEETAGDVITSKNGFRYVAAVEGEYLWIRPDGLAERAPRSKTFQTLSRFDRLVLVELDADIISDRIRQTVFDTANCTTGSRLQTDSSTQNESGFA